ncbi:MAG: glycerophosphodiester phosphodiesterase [Alphaproteobacteria bacterium]|nr:glycerophosphodiester phosphodiesterase [Alphaproteobacteria bacterium]
MTANWLTDTPFAHRGLHGAITGAVENSLSAFQAANRHRHGIELDVLLSRDSRPVVFHDMTLKRLTGRDGMVQDFTAAQLAAMPLDGSDDGIMTLRHILANIDPAYPVLIEIKADQRRPAEIAAAVVADICDYPGPKAIMSFDPEIILWFRSHAPGVVCGLVATSIRDSTLPEKYFSPAAQKLLIDTLAVDFIAYDIDSLPNDATAYCRRQNIPLLTWTIRTAEQRHKAAQFCDNIIYETRP